MRAGAIAFTLLSVRDAYSNGFCFDANAVKGVYGVYGGREAVMGSAGEIAPVGEGNGVCGTTGESGPERAPGYIVCTAKTALVSGSKT